MSAPSVALRDARAEDGWLSGLKRRLAKPFGASHRAGSNPAPSAPIVNVTGHAMMRVRERYGFSVSRADVLREVTTAISIGRLATYVPGRDGHGRGVKQGALCAYVPDKDRFYVVIGNGEGWNVVTALPGLLFKGHL